jgi:hypothetical protein
MVLGYDKFRCLTNPKEDRTETFESTLIHPGKVVIHVIFCIFYVLNVHLNTE